MKKIFNPFNYLAGEKTILWGAAAWAVTLTLAWTSGQSFRGVVSLGYTEMPIVNLAAQSLAGWVVLTVLLYAAAAAFSRSKVRLVDIAGNQLFARIALMPMIIVGALPAVREVSMSVLQAANLIEAVQQNMATLMTVGCTGIAVLVWFLAWSYMGFSVAANLRGWKGGAIYALCYIAAEILGGMITARLA